MQYKWKGGAPRVGFITGGGSGLGRRFAEILLAEGASVALFDLRFDETALQEIRKLAKPGQQVMTFACNVTDSDGLATIVADAVARLGAPDLAINCAGIQAANPFEKTAAAEFEKVMMVNLFGTRNFAAAILPHMQPGSRLALVASLAGKVGNYGYASYCASKYAVVGLAEVLRIEQMLRGVNVSVICPGEVETPMVAEEREAMHPVTKALKEFGGTLQPEVACDLMMRELARGKFTVVPGFRSKMTLFLSTRLPGLLRRTIDKTAKQAWASMQQGG